MMRRASILAMLAILATSARAEDAQPAKPPAAPAPAAKPVPPLTPEQAADAVLAAVKTKADVALKALAAKDDPDPWLVADELIRRGELDVANTFAKAAPRKDVEGLPVYIASRRGTPDDEGARKSLAAANAALAAGKPADAIEALGPPDAASPADVVGIRRAFGRGIALAAVGRLRESATAFLVAGDATEQLGWLARAARALHEAGIRALNLSDYAGAIEAWERCLRIAEYRGSRADTAGTLANIGNIYSDSRNFPKALEYEERALKLIETLGDRARVAATLGNIANIHYAMGSYSQALAFAERVLKMEEEFGDASVAAHALNTIGNVHYSLGSYPKAIEYQERALKIVESLGARGDVARTLGFIGNAQYSLGNFSKSLDYMEQSLKLRQGLGDSAGEVATLGNIGKVHLSQGNYQKALEYQERALKRSEELGYRVGVADMLAGIVGIHLRLENYPKALEYGERALKMMEALGDRSGEATMLGNIGVAHERLGNYPKAIEYDERALKMQEDLGDRAGVAAELVNIGNVYLAQANYAKALEYNERGLKTAEAARQTQWAANALGNIGLVHEKLGNYPTALEYHERSLKVKEGLGDRSGAAATVTNIGQVHYSLGNYPKALEYHERALKMIEELGLRRGIAATLSSIGAVYTSLGGYARALEYHERALKAYEELGDRAGAATTLGNIGIVHGSLGNYPMALDYQQRALKVDEELGDGEGVARALSNIGIVHRSLGNLPRALEYSERALKTNESIAHRAGVADNLLDIGAVHYSLGNYPRALEYYERALKMSEELGLRWGVASALGAAGVAYYSLGNYPKALEVQGRALALARDVGLRHLIVFELSDLSITHLALKEPAEAAHLAREALEEMSELVGGLADEQGASAREQFAWVFATGARAAKSLRDSVGASFFLESGRAGTLLEGLGGRGRLLGRMVPEDLRQAEALARAREAIALATYRKADTGSKSDEILKLRADLDAARDGVTETIERIQREAKRAADVLYPKAAELAEIQATLEETEALVLYGLFSEESMALVVTKKDARIIDLGRTKSIETAYEAAMLAVLDKDLSVDAAKVEALRDLVAKPLGLRDDTKRVLVSLDGVISYAPISILFPDREVVEVPSGTTYRLLIEDRAQTGQGVLALGDPDVDARPDPTAVAVYVEGVRARGGSLGRLPSAREEAMAVGDVLLIDKEASQVRLREALARRPRWRAVHFACHGLVDPERPMLSSLALTPSGDDEGFLTALDVFRLKIPADLVVLSACETGKGKVYGGEGIMGLTRAFMFAGAPRVICSLWKVDDAATKALMVKFYELWNPKDPAKAMGTAAALKAAQEYIRIYETEVPDVDASQREGRAVTKRVRPWEKPYYWAAWVLWGLPD